MIQQYKQIGEFLPKSKIIILDKRDQKILSLLLSDATLPYSKLSKLVALSKSNVARRIALLEEKGVVTGYHAFVDVSKLGMKAGLLLLQTQESQEKKQQIIEKIMQYKSVYSVLELTGKYDILVTFYYKKDEEKDAIVENILSLVTVKDFYSAHIKTVFPKIDYTKELFAKIPQEKKTEKNIAYDASDLKILKMLSENCRRRKIDIAKQVKISRETVSYRIKKLVSSGIVAKLQASVNPFSLGFEAYFLTLKLLKPTQRAKISNFLSQTLRCNTILCSEGKWDIITFIHFKSHAEFRIFENKMLELFKEAIHEYSFEYVKSQHKLDWFLKFS